MKDYVSQLRILCSRLDLDDWNFCYAAYILHFVQNKWPDELHSCIVPGCLMIAAKRHRAEGGGTYVNSRDICNVLNGDRNVHRLYLHTIELLILRCIQYRCNFVWPHKYAMCVLRSMRSNPNTCNLVFSMLTDSFHCSKLALLSDHRPLALACCYVAIRSMESTDIVNNWIDRMFRDAFVQTNQDREDIIEMIDILNNMYKELNSS
ncbi:hypothetical protein GJ496_005318 [Pomphorhynchus laevis]|nr:hypothetical protein GJ496_005318 [Pomphorhynchus laevis]